MWSPFMENDLQLGNLNFLKSSKGAKVTLSLHVPLRGYSAMYMVRSGRRNSLIELSTRLLGHWFPSTETRTKSFRWGTTNNPYLTVDGIPVEVELEVMQPATAKCLEKQVSLSKSGTYST